MKLTTIINVVQYILNIDINKNIDGYRLNISVL
jgi:hypothetical protein